MIMNAKFPHRRWLVALVFSTPVLLSTDPALGESPEQSDIESADQIAGRTVDVRRCGFIAKLRPGKLDDYKNHHAQVWPEVTRAFADHHIQNLSAWVKELEPGEHYIFAYFEYSGDDFAGDFEQLAAEPASQKWHKTVDQDCLVRSAAGSFWAPMEEVFYFAGAANHPVDPNNVKRYGQVIGIRPALVDSYKLIHKHAWPEVLKAIRRGNIRNYPIYMTTLGEKVYIFGYMEYVGSDFDADMQEIDSDPATKAWIKFTDEVCQLPIPTRQDGEWWANMENVVHLP
jgi:L-rhamnose mutarotase